MERRPLTVATQSMVTAIFALLSVRIVFKPTSVSSKKIFPYITTSQPKAQTRLTFSSFPFFFFVVGISNSQEGDCPRLTSKVVVWYQGSRPEAYACMGLTRQTGDGRPQTFFTTNRPQDFTLHSSNTRKTALWFCHCTASVRYRNDLNV